MDKLKQLIKRIKKDPIGALKRCYNELLKIIFIPPIMILFPFYWISEFLYELSKWMDKIFEKGLDVLTSIYSKLSWD